jgi:cytochrome bd-type quinol oxidase subunit 2
MQSLLTDLFSLSCVLAGWYYLFYSKAAARLAKLEETALNARRIFLRRICAIVLILLGAAIFTAKIAQDRSHPAASLACWLAVLILLAAVIALAWADMRLTLKLQRKLRDVDLHGDQP